MSVTRATLQILPLALIVRGQGGRAGSAGVLRKGGNFYSYIKNKNKKKIKDF